MSALYLFIILLCFSGVIFITRNNFAGFQWNRYFSALLSVSVPFLIWDYFATEYGHWAFNEKFTFGFTIFGMPIAEILFFVAVPLYFVAVFEVISRQNKKFTKEQTKKIKMVFKILRFVGVPLFTVLAVQSAQLEGRSYTFIVSSVTALSLLLLSYSLKYSSRPWILTNMFSYIAFILINGVLTASPVVTYSSFETLNYRIGSIPVEDFLYNFALTNLFLLAYTIRRKQTD